MHKHIRTYAWYKPVENTYICILGGAQLIQDSYVQYVLQSFPKASKEKCCYLHVLVCYCHQETVIHETAHDERMGENMDSKSS